VHPKTIFAVVFAALLCLPPADCLAIQAAPLTLRSGGTYLAFVLSAGGRCGLQVRFAASHLPGGAFRQDLPLAVDVVEASGETLHLRGGYSTETKTRQGVVCAGTLATPHGTRFQISNTYQALPSHAAFALSRAVSIAAASQKDVCFNSQFSLEPETPTRLTDDDCFVPGIWYKRNAYVPPTALASHLTDQWYLFREDRLPLPLMMTRDRRTGTTLALAHLDGSPATFAGEDGLSRIADARMQFGSLGLVDTERPSPIFMFPGTEGERTYTYGGSVQGGRWAYRSHPVKAGVPHSYRLLIALSRTPDFPAAVRRTWRMAYALAAPPVIPADLGKVYKDSVDLLAAATQPYNGIVGVPFAVSVPGGAVSDTSSEMGFAGQALPSAATSIPAC
jgi:hypothetical protein